jgi:ubiquinone/menaquinone biosynthesis C-methylase UbiE
MANFLHVGCGRQRKERTTAGFNTPDWHECRLDIDSAVQPDIVGTITDMALVADGSMDALYSSHNIEHLYPHEVPVALKEFHRVLGPHGFAVITCPDLQSVAELIAQDKLLEAAYQSPAGPISPLDILYGHRPALAAGNLWMAHHSGFTLRSLMSAMRESGFASVIGRRQPAPAYALWVIATKTQQPESALRTLAAEHFPR